MKCIVRCSCGGVKTKMEATFSLLFPNDKLPQEYRGSDNITKLAKTCPNTNFSNYLLMIIKNRGRYCYYFDVDEKYNITTAYNLMTGEKIQ